MREDIGAATGVFDVGVGRAYDGFEDVEAGFGQRCFDVALFEETEVQLHRLAEEFVAVHDFAADMEREEKQTFRLQHATQFTQRWCHVAEMQVHDGVESNNSNPRAVRDIQRAHVAGAKHDLGMQTLRDLDHPRRNVDA